MRPFLTHECGTTPDTSAAPPAAASAGHDAMNNTYIGQIHVGSGLQTVTIQAKDLYTARKLLEAMYGTTVINLHQPS